jgi:hypothetical protein
MEGDKKAGRGQIAVGPWDENSLVEIRRNIAGKNHDTRGAESIGRPFYGNVKTNTFQFSSLVAVQVGDNMVAVGA